MKIVKCLLWCIGYAQCCCTHRLVHFT